MLMKWGSKEKKKILFLNKQVIRVFRFFLSDYDRKTLYLSDLDKNKIKISLFHWESSISFKIFNKPSFGHSKKWSNFFLQGKKRDLLISIIYY